jgi:hypothetical protein
MVAQAFLPMWAVVVAVRRLLAQTVPRGLQGLAVPGR